MRILIQRSKNSKVTIDGKVNGEIDKGYVLFVGFTEGDNKQIVDKMIDKVINLRIFEDENEKMNLSINDVGGSILSISQFTLYANCKEGRRPSFVSALNPDEATILYDKFNEELAKHVPVKTGVFGSHMEISFTNIGPHTIILEK